MSCQSFPYVKERSPYTGPFLSPSSHREMSHMVLEGLTLYVNSSGGYCMSLENITNRYESETLMWPVFSEDDIRIKKWPGGTHYYFVPFISESV